MNGISKRVSNFPVSLVGLTVDEKGRPRDICVLREAGHGLDREAGLQYSCEIPFEAETLDGKPVPVRVVIGVNFESF